MTQQKSKQYKCAGCHKEVEGDDFPYGAGWKYIYDLEWKVSKHIRATMHDVQFCCKECMLAYLDKYL